MSVAADVMHGTLLDRLRARSKTFVLLAAWASAWLALVPMTLRVYGKALFIDGLTPAIVIERSRFAWLHTTFGWDIIDALFACVALAFVIVFVLSVTLETLAWVLRLDREDRPVASLRWTARAIPAVVLWSLFGVVLVALGVLLSRGADPMSRWAYTPAVIGLLWWMLLPFFALNGRELQRSSPAFAWRPAWPGVHAVVASILLVALMVVADWATDAALVKGYLSELTKFIADTAVFVITLWPLSALLYLWLNRTGARALRDDAAAVFSWKRTIGELLSLDVRGIVILAIVLAVPGMVTTFLMVFLVPTIEQANTLAGSDFPAPVAAAVDAARWLGGWWWALTPAVSALVLVARGRVYVAMGRVRVLPEQEGQ